MIYIKKGYGFAVGYDFARANEDTPIEVDIDRGGFAHAITMSALGQ
jgi:hypothetical protein